LRTGHETAAVYDPVFVPIDDMTAKAGVEL